ncbi:hypothetical protein [Capnocytophaga sp.]|uniref:hypothetical protein n=1 Tax=Capnocytophaga sp. TaxID=44737 RepID=UPI0026DAA7BB|nr:hypothetical protein [Capnocytophaga sp.]MDO5106539.1 hypothetical protein [Capnocytophaga sp.]
MMDLIRKIEIVLAYFEKSNSKMGMTIYQKYSQLKKELEAEHLDSNPIKGSVRAYLDAFNDWDNPILAVMDDLEKEIAMISKSTHKAE